MSNFDDSFFHIYILPLESQQFPSPQTAGQKEDDALRRKRMDRYRMGADTLFFFRPQNPLFRAIRYRQPNAIDGIRACLKNMTDCAKSTK